MSSIKFRSGLEAKVAASLNRNKIRFEYEPHVIKYTKEVLGGQCRGCSSKDVFTSHTYLPDFFLPDYNFYIEVKGKFTPEGRTKILSIINSNPKLDLRMLFQRDNYLSIKHHGKYSDWCKKNNIVYSVSSTGEVPKEWKN